MLLFLTHNALVHGAESSISYPTAAANVSYQNIQALPFTEPVAKLSYARAQPDLQYGLLWLPSGETSATPAPLVIFIHGGCWLNTFDVRYTYAFATALAQAGYAVWSLEYRRTGDVGGGWPGTFEDILAGIKARQLLREYPVDINNFVIMGHSAGGHLALLAGVEEEQALAVVGLAAIADIAQYARGTNSCQAVTDDFMGAEPDSAPERYAAANPARQTLHNKTYLLEGSADEIVPMSTTPIAGVQRLIAEDAAHFDWVHPGTPAFGLVLQLLNLLYNNTE